MAIMVGDKDMTSDFNEDVRLVKKGSFEELQVVQTIDITQQIQAGTEVDKNLLSSIHNFQNGIRG